MSPCPDSDPARAADGSVVALPLGCANRANLRAMLADPADLDHGRTLAPATGEQEARAVEAYRKGEAKKLSTDDQTGSTMSAPTTPESP